MVLKSKLNYMVNMSISEDENVSDLNPQFKFEFNCTQLTYSQNKSVERGGKLLLPLWALDSIYYMNVPSPYLFKLTNESNHRYSHAGVLEFTADEDHVCVPLWLMKHLGLKEEDKVTIESVSLPSATYCKLLPLTRNTAYISDSKAVLEENLRHFCCLTEGDILSIYEPNKIQIYKLKVEEIKPESAVSIICCDMDVDFDLPEKCKQKRSCKTVEKVKTEHQVFSGQGYRLDGTSETSSSEYQSLKNSKKRKSEQTFVSFSDEGQQTADDKSKATKINEGEPQNKRHCGKTKNDSSINRLIFIREKQKEYAKQNQSSGNPKQFPGKGHSLTEK